MRDDWPLALHELRARRWTEKRVVPLRSMTIHIIKLCVGAESVEDLAEHQIEQLKRARKAKANAIHPNQKAHPVCGTRMWPKRIEDVLAGGSLYWVIKGVVSVRQRILAIDDVIDNHGQPC